jgi:WD40 repeat protein
VSLWDARQGLCVQTFYGHNNAVDSIAFNFRVREAAPNLSLSLSVSVALTPQQGDDLVSSDSDGVVKVWDVRMVRERATIRNPAGRYPATRAGFDRSGKVVAVGYEDCVIRTYARREREREEKKKKKNGLMVAAGLMRMTDMCLAS